MYVRYAIVYETAAHFDIYSIDNVLLERSRPW